MTKEQALNKLALLIEQARKHAEAHGLQVFTFYEAKEQQVAKTGHCTPELLVNIAADMAMNHPDAVRRARALMMEHIGRSHVEGLERPIAEA